MHVVRFRETNKTRPLAKLEETFITYYSGKNPVFDERYFEHSFSIPSTVFNRIFEGLSGSGSFVRKKDGTNKVGIYPIVLIIAELRIV